MAHPSNDQVDALMLQSARSVLELDIRDLKNSIHAYWTATLQVMGHAPLGKHEKELLSLLSHATRALTAVEKAITMAPEEENVVPS